MSWRPQVGDRVHVRWHPELGMGAVLEFVGCTAIVDFDRPLATWRLFVAPSNLTKSGRRIDCGSGRHVGHVAVVLAPGGGLRGIHVVSPAEGAAA